MFYTQFIKRNFNLHLPTVFSDWFGKKDPEEFKPNGSQIYFGYQGEGKTLSMVFHMRKIKAKYPKLLIVSNLHLTELEAVKYPEKISDSTKQYYYFASYDDLIYHLRYTRNGKFGVLFAIDEIHNYFHSHDSKSMPTWVVQVFSQQRKQKVLILGTVQDWEDVIKAIRRQIDNLITCKKVGHMIIHGAIDPREFENQYGERIAPVKKKGFFFMTKKLRDSYDTYQVIQSGREIFGGEEMNVKINQTIEKPKKSGKWAR